MAVSALALALACLVGAIVGGAVIAHAYARELRRMAGFLRARDQKGNARLTTQLPGRALAELAGAVNGELDAIQQERIDAEARRTGFQCELSNLSHDIRTPLMGAKGRLQLARDEANACERAAGLDAATGRLDDVEALLDQLFTYARAADPNTPLAIERIAVLPVLEHVLVGQVAAFEACGMEPVLRMCDAALTVDADREALTRIFDNIIVNALRHGSGASLIIAGDAGADGRARLTFSNAVPDPARIDVAHLFDRFWRADTARAAGGSGIGLATVASLCNAMGFQASAALDGSTLTITITF